MNNKIETYNDEELDFLRAGGRILSATHKHVEQHIRPGISTLELDQIAEQFILSQNATPSFKGYSGYKFATCISVNEEAIHCIPRSDKLLKEGDIVSIDIGVLYNGFCTDAARTLPVGKISQEAQQLINATRQSFYEGIRGLKALSKVGDIGKRIEEFITSTTTFSLIEQYCGHGIGKNPHQPPMIPNYVPKTKEKKKLLQSLNQRLPSGSVIAIEPMVNAGVKEVVLSEDKWSTKTQDGRLSAHHENTVIILEDGVEVITE